MYALNKKMLKSVETKFTQYSTFDSFIKQLFIFQFCFVHFYIDATRLTTESSRGFFKYRNVNKIYNYFVLMSFLLCICFILSFMGSALFSFLLIHLFILTFIHYLHNFIYLFYYLFDLNFHFIFVLLPTQFIQ